MVKKLYKHELSALARMLVPVNLICLSLSLVLRLTYFIQNEYIDNTVFDMLNGLLLMFFVISIIAVFFVSYAMIIVRFYRHLLSSEGYLSMTLPVKASTHIITKTVCSMIFMIISAIVVIGSALIAASASSEFVRVMREGARYLKIIADVLGPSTTTLIIIETVLIMLTALIQSILMPYAAMALGQCARKSKIGMAVAWYFIINIILQIVSNVVTLVTMFFIGSFNLDTIYASSEMEIETFEDFSIFIKDMISASGGHIMMIESILLTAVTAIIFYIITHYILKNKLNLE